MIFKIKKNRHYSNRFLYKLFNLFNFDKRIKFKVMFDESSFYDLGDKDQADINKLFGFSDGFHHKNSVRFGWNSVSKDSVAIYSYCYINGVRKTHFITTVNINQEYKMSIKETDKFYLFTIIDPEYNIVQDMVEKGNTNNGFSYNLWPYFGGNKKAPHDIKISLN